jgi:predicted histone-like DNA-binding protein
MSVKYILVERGNPAKPTAPKKFYAHLKSSGEVTTRQLIKEISARSTVSAADTMAVIESLLELLPEKLSQGQIVRLGDFGSFSASVTSSGADKAADFRPSLITRYSIRFRAGKELTKAVASIEYHKVDTTK